MTRAFVRCIACLASVAASLGAQEQKPTLDIQTADGQTTFHIGERIPLQLTFTSPNDAQYVTAALGYARSAEFDPEKIEVTPSAGWSDPLTTDFEQHSPFAFSVHPPSPLLKSKALQFSIDLNEWVRFDVPGTYKVKVLSRRVFETSAPGNRQVELESKTFDVQIVPATAEWQDATLKSIQDKMTPPAQSLYSAVADLRYLGTAGAIEEMVSRLGEGPSAVADECKLGILGLPDAMRGVAIASMRKRISEPDFPISRLFFSTMESLHVKPGSSSESISQQLTAFEAVLWPSVLSSVRQKDAQARPETVQTLLELELNSSSPAVKARMALLLAESFLEIDSRRQIDDLRWRWDLLRSPAILPVLRTLAMLTAANSGGYPPYSRADLKSVAFRRWYALDPAGAHREILREINSATPELSADGLRFLPAEALPQYESIWADAFVAPKDQMKEAMLGSLLVRFGTGTAISQMIAKLNEPSQPYFCEPHSLALAYLVRFSPQEARPRLEHEIAANEGKCDGSVLERIAERTSAPVLNDVAVEMLNDKNSANATDAIRYLSEYGRERDEKPMWDLYEKWADQWKGKEDLLKDRAHFAPIDGYSYSIGMDLSLALLSSQGWVANQSLISGVLGRCVGELMCNRLKDLARLAGPPYSVTPGDTSDWNGSGVTQTCTVAQYSPMTLDLLEAKLQQFSPGTQFVLSRIHPETDDQRKLEEHIRVIFKRNNMILKDSMH